MYDGAGLVVPSVKMHRTAGRKGFEMFKRTSVLLLGLAVILLVGCSKAPEMEMQAADAAMQSARTAEAEQYAPQAYRVAMDTLNAAKAAKQEQDSKFALFRSYGKSKQGFISAQALLESAKTEAEQEKERVRLEVMDLMTRVQASIDSATAALASAPKGKGSKADIEMIQNDLNSVNASFAAAKVDFEAGKFLVAKSKFETVMAGAQRIVTEIEAAKARKR
ncbi:MAG TPA: hypothetical protein VN285_05375 [Candidatus Deferrimicrobium sp.]|nr:hypothetical protein [Candidatus Deferrimicrobium sp.]